MSADEFDPEIERLFARTPVMADAAQFTSGVQARLETGGRVRALALTVAGLIGGVVAVRETMKVDLQFGTPRAGDASGPTFGEGLQTMTFNTQSVVESGLDQLGLAGIELGAMGGMQLFWIAAGAVVAMAAAGIVRLSQEI